MNFYSISINLPIKSIYSNLKYVFICVHIYIYIYILKATFQKNIAMLKAIKVHLKARNNDIFGNAFSNVEVKKSWLSSRVLFWNKKEREGLL